MDQKTTSPSAFNNTSTPSSSRAGAGGAAPGQNAGGAAPANDATSKLTHEAHSLASGVKDVAGDVAGEAKKMAESKLDAGKDFATEHLDSLARALHKTGQDLRGQESSASDYVEKAAGSLDRVASYMKSRTLSQLAGDLESFARREPALFLGGSFLAGVLGGRFFKAATPSTRRGARMGNRPAPSSPGGGMSTPVLPQRIQDRTPSAGGSSAGSGTQPDKKNGERG